MDYEAKTISLIWEFLPTLADGTPLVCFHGGSIVVHRENSKKRFVSFPCDNTATKKICSIAAYEIEDDVAVATIQFSRVVSTNEKFIGSYRAEPWNSIYGEFSMPNNAQWI